MADASRQDRTEPNDIERQLARRELFEKMVMVPVSVGMLAASTTYVGHGRHDNIIIPLSVALALVAFLLAAANRLRR